MLLGGSVEYCSVAVAATTAPATIPSCQFSNTEPSTIPVHLVLVVCIKLGWLCFWLWFPRGHSMPYSRPFTHFNGCSLSVIVCDGNMVCMQTIRFNRICSVAHCLAWTRAAKPSLGDWFEISINGNHSVWHTAQQNTHTPSNRTAKKEEEKENNKNDTTTWNVQRRKFSYFIWWNKHLTTMDIRFYPSHALCLHTNS